MSTLMDKKERWHDQLVVNYTGKCPLCKEQGSTTIFALGDDSFFCENPNCDCIRHASNGYYQLTSDDINLDDVDMVSVYLFLKRGMKSTNR